MKHRICKSHNTYHITRITIFLMSILALSLALSSVVKAEEGVPTLDPPNPTQTEEPTPESIELPKIKIQLQVETFDQTLYNDNFEITACLSAPSSTEATLNAWCAIEQLAQANGWIINYSTYGDAKFLSAINNYDGADFNWWAFFHGLNFANEALNQYIVSENEHILLSYGISPLKIEGDDKPLVNTTTTIKAYAFGFDTTSWTPVWSLTPDATIIINDQENPSADGTYDFWTNTTTTYIISAQKTGYINSKNFLIGATLPNTNIHLQIAGPADNLFSGTINVPACEQSVGNGIYTINGKCAIQETKLDNNWSMWDNDAFLNSIGGFENNKDNNGIYWLWFTNLQDGKVALNKHVLETNENLLLTYGRYPLKIETETSSTTLSLNTTTTIVVREFGFDSEWNSAWIPSVSSTLVFDDGQEINNDSGVYELFIATTTPYIMYGKKNGFLDSAPTTIVGQEPMAEEPPAQDNPPNNSGGGGSGGGGNDNDQPPASPIISDADINTAVDKILAYLKSQQDATGKIIDGGITDWAIMAFASAGIYSEEVKNNGQSLLDYALSYNFTDSSDLNLCAAYPRHILALLAGGMDKTNAKITEIKNKINSQCINGAAYGQNGINDDIFGLFALLATDEDITTTSIQNIIIAIKADQTADGAFTWAGWPGADITGGAINALKYAETKGASIEQQIYSNAKTYLKNAQLPDGGWGYGVSDALTTGWAVMGLDALGETGADWFTSSSTTPWHVLVNQLNDIGYYESAWVPGTVDWFAAKHAVPALLGKSWPVILPPKQNTEPNEQNTSATGASNNSQNTETATSTAPSIAAPTSTIELVIEAPTSTTATTTMKEETGNLKPETNEQQAESLQTTTQTAQQPSPIPYHISPTPLPTTPATNTDNETPVVSARGGTTGQAMEQWNNDTISSAPEDTLPINKTAKGVFAGATSLAGALGLYLAWRFIQTIV
ncbi:MAG: terpene cyclase/mutase family protein [Candidatus Magasanikbacteria bacterium]|nr:terpene cyclase/mutase family protein [Candidatus Magasanikbacteria bacterium]